MEFVLRGVHVLVICVQIHVRLDCFSHSITIEVWKPARWKTAKIHWNKHTPVVFSCFNIGIAYSNFTFCCTKLPAYTRSGEKCENFSKTSTPLETDRKSQTHPKFSLSILPLVERFWLFLLQKKLSSFFFSQDWQKPWLSEIVYYCPQTKFAKVMFLHPSVSHG